MDKNILVCCRQGISSSQTVRELLVKLGNVYCCPFVLGLNILKPNLEYLAIAPVTDDDGFSQIFNHNKIGTLQYALTHMSGYEIIIEKKKEINDFFKELKFQLEIITHFIIIDNEAEILIQYLTDFMGKEPDNYFLINIDHDIARPKNKIKPFSKKAYELFIKDVKLKVQNIHQQIMES